MTATLFHLKATDFMKVERMQGQFGWKGREFWRAERESFQTYCHHHAVGSDLIAIVEANQICSTSAGDTDDGTLIDFGAGALKIN